MPLLPKKKTKKPPPKPQPKPQPKPAPGKKAAPREEEEEMVEETYTQDDSQQDEGQAQQQEGGGGQKIPPLPKTGKVTDMPFPPGTAVVTQSEAGVSPYAHMSQEAQDQVQKDLALRIAREAKVPFQLSDLPEGLQDWLKDKSNNQIIHWASAGGTVADAGIAREQSAQNMDEAQQGKQGDFIDSPQPAEAGQ